MRLRIGHRNPRRNLRDEYDTIDEALASLRQTIADHGRSVVAEWALEVTDGEDTQTIAEGAALVTLALGVPAAGAAATA